MSPTPTPPRFVLSEPVAAIALLVLATACAGLLFALKRAVEPGELPPLVLPEPAVREVLAKDAEAAQAAPDNELAAALEAQLLEHGRREARGRELVQDFADRKRALEAAFRELAAAVGESAALRLRARNALALEDALDLRLPEADASAVLGSFPAILAREGASRDGRIVAPRFVVRVLFKARWNILHGFSPAHALSPIEERAYYGWQALHTERLPIMRRIQALESYAKVGGEQVREALAVLLYRNGDAAGAAEALGAAYRARGGLRLRNYHAGAQARAQPARR